MNIYFDGSAPFTAASPTNGDPADPKAFSCSGSRSLRAALDSRIAIEQAKGILAGRLRITVEQSVRTDPGNGPPSQPHVHELAAEIVEHPETPEAITLTTPASTHRRPHDRDLR